MKKLLPTLALILAAFMLLSLTSAFADSAETPAEADEPVDPLVGAWMMPPTPFGEDFRGFMVLNEDGSFLNATNFYDSPKCVGPFTQKVTTNETFTWVKLSDTRIELHYSYHDDNGEFITPLDYDPDSDCFYLWGSLYAFRDDTFEYVGDGARGGLA